MSKQFLVLGAGSWGTALAILLSRNGHDVKLWPHHDYHGKAMHATRSNEQYLPGILFPEKLQICEDLAHDFAHTDYVLIAVPSHAFLETLQRIQPYFHANMGLIWATKGFHAQGEFLHDLAKQVLGKNTRLAMLTGPSFAKEVASQLPTAVVLAAEDLKFAKEIQPCFHTPYFRTYLCLDLIGAQIGSAVKNVLAIAVGIADGLNYGTNTRAALMTRGLAEMIRLGLALGAQKDTFMGLSGLGDLILTCTDNQSRNRRFGLSLGQGKTAVEAKLAIGQVVEGVITAEIIHLLAERHHVDMPIIEQIYQVLYKKIPATEAVNALLSRAAGLES